MYPEIVAVWFPKALPRDEGLLVGVCGSGAPTHRSSKR
jgi:hypothetical protein